MLNKKTKKATPPMPEVTPTRHHIEGKPTTQELVKLSESLADLDWRLLHWLLRYPLQRADDLVVSVARWASRATVYRHVQALQAIGLLESALPKTSAAGKRLYHLSNFGMHVLAWHRGRPARELAREWQADEVGLLRLLPRLPTLLVLQNVVNGLVTHAAEALTTEGRRPRLVRWTWQRNVTHCFSYREQRMRLFADGVAALCIRTQQSDGTPLDKWYGLFLLFTELDDERLMHLRLERLLCWRESPERWPVYQHMLPVLILARSIRQRDHWQHAGETSALKLRLDPLQGAIACLPAGENAHTNPWRLSWRTPSTNHPCHLHDLLNPVPPATFLSALSREAIEEERGKRSPLNLSTTLGPARRIPRLVVGNLANRVRSLTQDDLADREAIALLGLHLTSCHWRVLRLLLAHPLLSDTELAGLLGLQRRSVRSSLSTLHSLGCLKPLVTEAGRRWHLSERGLRLMAAASHLHPRTFMVESGDEAESATAHLAQRGESWLVQHIQHTAGVYSFFAMLAQAARQQPVQALSWWETGSACERRYRVGEQWHNLRPDALADYRVGRKQVCFWLEWDRGTMNARDLAIKFASYAHYHDSREWAREWSWLPWLVCVAPDIAQERRMQRVAQVQLARFPGLVMWTSTEGLLIGYGPLAPIWLQSLPSRGQVAQPSGSLRQRLFAPVVRKNAI